MLNRAFRPTGSALQNTFWAEVKSGCRARGVSTSAFDLFKIGVGPSSSHTVGPMKACNDFVKDLEDLDVLPNVSGIKVKLYGSLALTGKGHASDQACLLGLSGMAPDKVVAAEETLEQIAETRTLALGTQSHVVPFDAKHHIEWIPERRPEHANAMTLVASDDIGATVHQQTYFSIGGGFIRTMEEMHASKAEIEQEMKQAQHDLHFRNMKELLLLCERKGMDIGNVMRHNEREKGRTNEEVNMQLDRIWEVMNACIDRGLTSTETHLPGPLNVKRRAPLLYMREKNFARSDSLSTIDEPYLPMMSGMSRLSVYAIAVNEENAGGWSQIVTAPTNGASGVIPACIRHMMSELLHARYVKKLPHLYESHEHAMVEAPRLFLLTAAAIGALIKQNSSISGAEAGCMGEVGSASSMAAAGLTACLGGSPEQVENAAEIAMEHSLGLTCDPIDGLVQVPCIERNAMGATKALNAATVSYTGPLSQSTF